MIDGRLCWDFELIFENVREGIEEASARARQAGREAVSVGVDSWAVDYGLLNVDGTLIADPTCYRDRRTEGVPEKIFEIVSRSEVFERMGIQFLDFNTLYQLYCDRDRLSEVDTLLLLPDLVNFRLCGARSAEYTNATTTQMLNVESRYWDTDLLNALGIETSILPNIVEPGSTRETMGDGTLKVVSVASHDTASAVVAAPLTSTSAYISSGTWSLVGVELQKPLVNNQVAAANFTNEGGAFGTIRFLKNVMGMWLLERCREEWKARSIETSYDKLVDAAFEIASTSVIFPDDPRFVNPPSMVEAIKTQLVETKQEVSDEPEVIAKVIFDSLALRYASVLRRTSDLSGREITRIEVLGGGGRNRYLNQMTANATGLTVRSGLYEATVVGNALVQAIANEQFADLAEARRYIERTSDLSEFVPTAIDPRMVNHYAEIEDHYL
jgi:rhamnulokinase